MRLQGTLVLVVGPSGAGKDSVIQGAASRLREIGDFVFVRRTITRPESAGGEPHVAVSAAEFARCRDRGAFLLHWQAHGLDYGIPATIAAHRAVGRTVIANVSRSVIAAARAKLAPIRVVQILAPRDVLAFRLAQRGRESEVDIRQRLGRDAGEIGTGPDVTTIMNDGALAQAVDAFVAILRDSAAQLPALLAALASR